MQPKLWEKWLFSLVFIMFGIFFIRPLMVRQLLQRTSAYLQYNMANDALRVCRKAVFIDKFSDSAWNKLAFIYDSIGEKEKAYQTAKQAAAINPKNRTANFRAGLFLFEKADYAGAADYFEKIKSLGPESKDELGAYLISYYNFSKQMLGLCYQKLGRPAKN